jgi:hypothetical protein
MEPSGSAGAVFELARNRRAKQGRQEMCRDCEGENVGRRDFLKIGGASLAAVAFTI